MFRAFQEKKIQTFKEIFIPIFIILHMYFSVESFFVVYGSFNCISLFGLPNQVLYYDHSIQCWDDNHKMWTYGLAMPLLIVWLILLPILLFLKVILNLKLVRERNEKFINTYGVVTRSLNDNCFYWEFLIYAGKQAGVIINTFLARMTEGLCGLFLVLAFIIISTLQNMHVPYRSYI